MKKIITPALVLFSFFCFLLMLSCSKSSDKSDKTENDPPLVLADAPETTLSPEELVSKGEHLVAVAGCDDCHSPKKMEKGMPVPDMSRRLSGHPADLKVAMYDKALLKNGWTLTNQHFTAWVGFWGTSFSSNITPDVATGIGNWTEENFMRAMREGKYGGTEAGRSLLPPMPWPNIAKYTDEELKAIFAYLKTIPPVKNAVPAPIPAGGK